MYKIAMVSDIHFGCRNNSEKYLNIMKDFFLDTLSKVLEEKNINDLRILGDVFDNRNNVNIRTMNVVLYVFRELTKKHKDLQIKIILGNHDVYYHNRIDINSIECLREIKNIEIIDKVTQETINNKTILMVPWLVKDSETYTDFIRYTGSKKKIDVCLGHFEIKDFEMIRGIKDETGFEHGIFENFKRVFSGHYHLRNTIGKISYLGCPYQLTWGDYGDTKGIHIYDVDSEKTEFIPNNDSPCFVKINMEDIINQNKKKISMVKGNFVKLIIEKKYKEAFVVKVINKMENLEPIRLDIQNDFVEDFNIDESKCEEFKDISDPLTLLVKYIDEVNTENEDNVDKSELKTYIRELYQLALKDSD